MNWNGFPPNPERDGWHWLMHRRISVKFPDPWEWNEFDEGFRWVGRDDLRTADEMSLDFDYVAPCPYPQGELK